MLLCPENRLHNLFLGSNYGEIARSAPNAERRKRRQRYLFPNL